MRLYIVILLILVVANINATRKVSLSGVDTGDCIIFPCQSLNFTISQSSSGDTIDLDDGTYSGALNRDIYIQNINLTIQGSSAARVNIDLQDQGRAFRIYNSIITIKSITFANGNAQVISESYFNGARGGAIYSLMSNLTLEDVNFDGCHSFGTLDSGSGGGLMVYQGRVSLNQVEFVNCFGGIGGGFHAQDVTGNVKNTNFHNCSTTGSSGWGGAGKSDTVLIASNFTFKVSLEAVSNFLFDNCTFVNCNSSFGGALEDGGDSVYLISRSTFQNNQATYGGAVYHFAESQGTFEYCDFIGNTASTNGGAVQTTTTSAPIYTACNFYNNSAVVGGALVALSGNITTIIQSTFQYNHAIDTGSAIAIQGPVVLTDNVFDQNTCGSKGTLSFLVSPSASSSISGNIFTRNTAIRGAAIHIEIDSNTEAWNIVNTTCENNVATVSGGAVYLTSFSAANFQTAFFKGNSANNGGAVTVDMRAQVTFNMSSFEFNAASNEGGGIFLAGSSLFFAINSSLSNNHALNGGALALSETVSRCPLLSQVTMQSNSAVKCCGAIYFADQAIQCSFNSICEDCILTANTVETCGIDCKCEQGVVTNDQCSPPATASPSETVPTSEVQNPLSGDSPQPVPVSTIVPAVVIPAAVVGVGIFLVVFFVKKRKATQSVTTSINMQNLSVITNEERLQVPYNQLKFNKEIGSGSFGKVFIGEWQKTEVALKLNTTGTSQEFIQEARLMIALRPHPNIVQFLGLSNDGPYPVMIIEFCDEGSLDNLLFDSEEDIPINRQLAMISAIAKGMYHLHSNNIVHRDLAARNILLSKGTVKISDFGMSRTLQNIDQGVTKNNIGPIRWMAPESLKSRTYSKSSDVWSFGILVFEIAARSEPHVDQDLLTIAPKIRDEGLTPTLPPNIDPFLVDLMRRCWNINPEARPTFEEICDLLQIRIDQ